MIVAQNFTPQQVAWITSLPLRRYRVGGTVKEGYYDEATGRIFMVNEAGSLTGETAVPRTPATQQSQENPVPSPDVEQPDVSENVPVDNDSSYSAANTDAGNGNGKKRGKQKKEKHVKEQRQEKAPAPDSSVESKGKSDRFLHVAIVALIVLFAALIIGIFLAPEVVPALSKPTPTPIPTATPTPEPTPTPTPPGMTEVPVIQVMGDVLKGQRIESSSVEKVSITMQEYNQLVAMGAAPCKWDELSTIEGMFANSFIAAGSYISNYYLTVADPIPANPWRDYSEGYQTMTLGMDALQGTEKPFFGALTVMTVTKDVDIYAEGAEPAPDLYWPEDSEEPNPYQNIVMEETPLNETVVRRVFTFTNALVCDLLNEAGESLFASYVPYVEMPTVNRLGALNAIMQDPNALAAMKPASIVVRLTDAEAAALGSLANATAVFTVNGNADASSDIKYSVAWGTQDIVNSLFPAAAAPELTPMPEIVPETTVDPAAQAVDGLAPAEDMTAPMPLGP